MTTTARMHRPRTEHPQCAWTRAVQHQLVRDLHWLVSPPGWTPLDNCGVQVAVRYHCADPRLPIGGDWHLSMPLAGGDLLLAIGDVAGHGLPAAAEMIRLRYAMAAFATVCAEPAAILGALNSVLCRRGDLTATAAAARFSPRTGELTWAQAGHLPILSVGAREVVRLPSPEGMMLGVDPAARYGQATTSLDPGDFVVLYTDGVLHRSQPIDQAIDVVASLAAAARCCPPALLDHVAYDAAGDDACVLVAERVR